MITHQHRGTILLILVLLAAWGLSAAFSFTLSPATLHPDTTPVTIDLLANITCHLARVDNCLHRSDLIVCRWKFGSPASHTTACPIPQNPPRPRFVRQRPCHANPDGQEWYTPVHYPERLPQATPGLHSSGGTTSVYRKEGDCYPRSMV